MTIFFAFLAGFYVGVFAISLLVVAGRRKEKEENNSSAGTAPGAADGPFLELARTRIVQLESSFDVGLSLENTLLTLLQLQSLASGFETFASRQKSQSFLAS